MELFYDRPAVAWEEALPVGNGSLGGIMCGGVMRERIALNEESVWSGFAQDKTNPEAAAWLHEIRRLVAQERYYDAEQLVTKHMLGKENESYLPLGILTLCYTCNGTEGGKHSVYRRYLDLEKAIAGAEYMLNGVTYRSEMFASYPEQALYIRIESSSPQPQLDIEFVSQLQTIGCARNDILVLRMKAPEHVSPASRAGAKQAFVQGDRGMEFTVCIEVLQTDGTCRITSQGIKVESACRIDLRISAVRTPGKERNYDKARTGHIMDYRELYARVTLSLGSSGTASKLPVDERLCRLKQGECDPELYALYFQYARYLLISSSRPGSLPANLQGIWNWEMHAPWRSNWTTNINLQMNYWPAHSCHLKECFEPYISFMQQICVSGQRTASVNYGCHGFVVHHNVDRWYSTTPAGITWDGEVTEGAAGWGMWPMGGVWLTDLLMQHYRYTLDQEYLHIQVYPVLRQAVLFVTDWVYEEDGMYQTCPSTSPENRFLDEQGRSCSISRSCTMDLTLIRILLNQYLEVCGILACEDELCSHVRTILNHLPYPGIASDGRLLEWEKDYTPQEEGHRHISHLYGLFPGECFDRDARLREACRVSLEHRLQHGGGHTGWSLAWILNVYAVLGDKEKFGDALYRLLTRSTYPNLWDAHPPFQIDGNFGAAAAMVNMLVQERDGEVRLLPGLPSMFATGYATGLCLPGSRCIDLSWKDGRLENYRIYPAEKE